MNDLAKVIRNGRNQLVSLPAEFELDGDAVRVRREGRNLVLEPVEPDMNWVDRLEALDDDAAAAALERPGPDSYERDDLRLN